MTANLLSNASTTGEAIGIGKGGAFAVVGDGTFGGATLQLQLLSPDGSSWISITDATLTAEGAFVVDLPDGATIRMLVSGGAPSALYASIGSVLK